MPKTEIAKRPATYDQVVNLRPQHGLAGSANALTDRERDILKLAARGLGNEDIAKELGISSCTVKAMLHRACAKLGAQNRFEAAFSALIRGYIGLQEVVSLDELVSIFASLGPEMIEIIAQRLRLKQLDELENILGHLGPDVIDSVVQRLRQKQEQLRLPTVVNSIK
jgi:DNA-binding CsgD family transcriptional regulator